MWVAIQPDGSRLRYEDWVVRMWCRGELTDTFLRAGLETAVTIYEDGPMWEPRRLVKG